MAQTIANLDPSKTIEDAAKEFKPEADSLAILLGDFDAALNDKIRSIISRVVVPIAVESGALIIDDASHTGCAPLVAQAILEQDKAPALIGIVANDSADTDIDPGHKLVLRLPADWSEVPKFWFQVAAALVPEAAVAKRVAVILFGGKDTDSKALLWCVRRKWPIILMGKTGGLADKILAALPAPGAPLDPAIDPELREIIEEGSLFPSSLDAAMDDLRRILLGRVTSNAETFKGTLKDAWARYDELDQTAIGKQTSYRRVQLTLIFLAVLVALFAILRNADPFPTAFKVFLHRWLVPLGTLHILVIATPILLSVVAAYNSHFREGNKWILLRGAAEAIKREIFRFRARAGAYSDEQCLQASRESKLTARIADIASSLEQSEVNKTNLAITPPGDESRQTPLKPDQYVVVRIQDQIGYFEWKTRKLASQVNLMQLLILAAGGIGTFLAAINMDIWVALATAFVTAFTTKLQADQTETSLVQYNQTMASLKNIQSWWSALSSWEKLRRTNIDLLIDQTEKAMEAETAGWVQQMQSALDKLTEKEAQPDGKSGTK